MSASGRFRRFGARAAIASAMALAMVTGGAAGAAFALEDPAPEATLAVTAAPAGPFAMQMDWTAVEGAATYVVEVASITYSGEWWQLYDGDAQQALLTMSTGEWQVRVTALDAGSEPLDVAETEGAVGDPASTVVSVTAHSARIAWDAVPGAEGYSVGWTNTVDPADNGSAVVSATEVEVAATGLRAEAEYETWISVLDGDGYMILSYQGPQVRTLAEPAPIAIEVGGIGTSSANVWWPEVEGAEQYVITTTDGTVDITQPATHGGFARLTGLARDTEYTVQVDAFGADGLLLASGTRSFRTLASFELRGVATGPTTVHLTWAPPLVDEETWIGGDNWAAPLPAGATEFTDHSVLPGQSFSYELLGERVEVTPEVGTVAPTVSGTTPTSAAFTWPAVYGGSVGVGGHVPRTVTYTVFVDGVQVGTTDSLTLDVGGLATAGHRMTIEASVIANRFIDDEFQENVRVVIARGAVDFSTVPAAAPAAPAAPAGTLPATGMDPVPLAVAAGVLLAGGLLAAVEASRRRAPARARR